jgi:hypothetical protein
MLVPQEQRHTILKDAHPGYITWQDFEENLRRLKENARAQASDRVKCGARMLVRYRDRG